MSETSETHHTPGPWRVIETRKDGFCVVDAVGQNLLYAIPAAEANARLAAAAPELLDALTECVAWIGTPTPNHEPWARALAAIAKASGGPEGAA